MFVSGGPVARQFGAGLRAHSGRLGSVLRWVLALWDAAQDLLLGAVCPGCRSRAGGLCPDCRAVLAGRNEPLEFQLGQTRCLSVGPYAGPIRSMVIAHKEHGVIALGRPLGHALGRLAQPALTGRLLGASSAPQTWSGRARGSPVWVLPMPSSRSAVRARGFDHCWRLAQSAAQELRRHGVPARAVRRLARSRTVRDQALLGRRERQRNQLGSMSWRGSAPDHAVVLVDDICTTGATLVEAVRVVEAAGGSVLLALTLARTELETANRSQFTDDMGPSP